MATPEAEETVAAPPTPESVVAEVVKSAETGDKEAPKGGEEPPKVEEEPTTANEEPTTEAPPADAAEETTEAAPVEEPTVPFKEESNVVADLKEPEKKALEEFKARIVKAIGDNEFKVPKKVVEAPKEPEPAETPKEPEVSAAAADETPAASADTTTPAAETPASETPAETPAAAADTPAAETPAVGTKEVEAPAAETSAVETPSTVTPAAEPPATEAPAAETPAAEAPAVETPAPEAPAAETPAPEPPATGPSTAEAPANETPVVEAKETKTSPAEPAVESEPAAPATTEEAPTAGVEEPIPEGEAKEAAAPVEESPAAETSAVEEEEEDLTPPEDVALWGVPLLHTKGDERTDVILLKFLRARDFNVSLAFEQLKKTIIWRKTFKADALLEEDFGTEFDGIAFDYGKDKDGHPVSYNVFAPFQSKELYAKAFGDPTKLASFIRWRIQVLEKSLKLLNFSPEGPSALVQIADLKNNPGLGKKEARSAYKQAVNILQDNYPELVVKMVFINIPWYFSPLYAVASPFISARTKSKFSRYTPARTTEGLLKFIPADQIPIAYGGLSKPNDPDFTGVEAPPTEVVIKAGEKATIQIPVTEARGTVVWELAVVGYDVTYGAQYVPTAEGSYTTILEKPKKLPSTTEEPLRSSFKITEAGKIVISIENAVRKKKIVIYRYAVKTPAAETEVN